MTAAWHAAPMRTGRLAIAIAALVALAGWTPFRTIDPDVEAGNQAYAEGRYNDALAAYDRARRHDSVDADGLAFDRGTAELALAEAAKDAGERTRLTDRALEDLKQATHSKDARIRGAASYNRGNSLMDQGKLEDAIEAYKQALRDDNQLDDARLNLELALRRRQRQKSQQQGQGQGSQGQGQGQGQQGQGQQGQGSQGSQGPQGSGGSADPQTGSNGGGNPQSGSSAGGKPQSGSNGGGGSSQPRNGSNDPGDPGDPGSNAQGSNQAPDPSGGTGGPGRGSQQPKGRPSRGRTSPAPPRTPADSKLDDLDEYSRKLQKDGARRRATGRAADPQHDW